MVGERIMKREGGGGGWGSEGGMETIVYDRLGERGEEGLKKMVKMVGGGGGAVWRMVGEIMGEQREVGGGGGRGGGWRSMVSKGMEGRGKGLKEGGNDGR